MEVSVEAPVGQVIGYVRQQSVSLFTAAAAAAAAADDDDDDDDEYCSLYVAPLCAA